MTRLRKLNNVERKHAAAFMAAQILAGEHKDDAIWTLAAWLVDRGWPPAPARERAREVYLAVLQREST